MRVREILLSKKDALPGVLMITSIVLLILVQVLWLASSWREAKEDFRKETNGLFRNTIFAMQDSILMENTMPVAGHPPSSGDSVGVSPGGKSLIDRIRQRDSTSVIEIFIRENNRDSVKNLLPPLARRMRMDKRNRRFIVHLGPDSLNIHNVETKFSSALSSAGFAVPFKVLEIRKTEPGRTPAPVLTKRRLVSEVVPYNPVTYYAVEFTSADHVFWKAITPQILFCVLLTTLTAGSFYSMNRSIRSQRRLVQMKNDFISNMSHELKTPVSTVSVALEALERFKGLDDPNKTSEYLMMAKSELRRLSLMVDRILQTDSFDVRKTVANKVLVNMDEKIAEVMNSLRMLFQKRNVYPRYEKRGSDFSLHGDPEQLTTLVYNLLDNAMKYTRDSPVISVVLEDRGDEMILSVRDNGVGIPQQYHRKVFEKFFRVPAGDVHDVRGYGLGLSYAASVVEQHHGSIVVESAPAEGSNFIVRLPKR